MGRNPLNGLFPMNNAQRQAHYRRNKKESETKVLLERDAFRSELLQSNHELQCLQCQTTDEKVQALLKEIERLKERITILEDDNRSIAEFYRELRIEKLHIERQLRDVTKEKKVQDTPVEMPMTVQSKRTEGQVIDD